MLDTNICIYIMKNKPEKVLRRFKEELNNGISISSITLAELEYGMKHSSNPAQNERALLRFLVPLSVLPFGAGAASEYGAIRTFLQNNGTPIGPLDMLIAAHAKSEGLVMVTNNVREFERVPGLEIENWAEKAGKIYYLTDNQRSSVRVRPPAPSKNLGTTRVPRFFAFLQMASSNGIFALFLSYGRRKPARHPE